MIDMSASRNEIRSASLRFKQSSDDLSQNLEEAVRASNFLVKITQEISGQWIKLIQESLKNDLKKVNRFANCNTIQDVFLLQNDSLLENLQKVIDTNRRVAELSALLNHEMATIIDQVERAFGAYIEATRAFAGEVGKSGDQVDLFKALVDDWRQSSEVDRNFSLISRNDTELKPSSVPVWRRIKKLGHEIPQEELEKVPIDLAKNLDQYLCGM